MAQSSSINTIVTLLTNAVNNISYGNKGSAYSPSGALASNYTIYSHNLTLTYGSGASGKTGAHTAGTSTKAVTFTVKNNTAIPAAYTTAITAANIQANLKTYLNKYNITSTVGKEVTVKSFLFIFNLFCNWLLTRTVRVSNILNSASVYLFNTAPTDVAPTFTKDYNLDTITNANFNSLLNSLTTTYKNYEKVYIIGTSSSVSSSCSSSSSSSSCSSSSCSSSSCSSSSCSSSSCSSSSSSSSCSSSSSSSSSSSAFIAYFNIG